MAPDADAANAELLQSQSCDEDARSVAPAVEFSGPRRHRLKVASLASILAATLLVAAAGGVVRMSPRSPSQLRPSAARPGTTNTFLVAAEQPAEKKHTGKPEEKHPGHSLEAPSTTNVADLTCGSPTENCLTSSCCDTLGYTCFQKNKYFASCKKACSANKSDPADPVDFRTPWTCKVLGGPGPDAKPEPTTTIAPPPVAGSNSGCYIVQQGKLLMLKHSYGTFDIPGGLAEYGEIPQKTACRETWEETGYKVTATSLKLIMPNGFHIFNCELVDPTQLGVPDPNEIASVWWQPVDALPQSNWRFQDELAILK